MASKLTSQIFLLSLITLMGFLYTSTLGNSQQELYLTVATLGLIALSLILERFFPLHNKWNKNTGDTAGDIGSFVFVFGVVDGFLKWLSPFIILALLPSIESDFNWPLWVQILAATFLIELGAWASHWMHHRYKPLWALHSMHHSTERLYTLNNFRFHPLNHVLNYLAMFLPLLALGVSKEAILGYTAISLPVLLLQHSNVGFNFGMLNYLFNTNSLHRWHHSTVYKEGMHNFGRAFILFDHLFGTFHNPSNVDEPRAVGLASSGIPYPRPSRTLKQILWPLSKDCCR